MLCYCHLLLFVIGYYCILLLMTTVPQVFKFYIAFVLGGLGFEFCVFVAGWRHALRSEWPFIIIIIIIIVQQKSF